jgi:hypothetical protein
MNFLDTLPTPVVASRIISETFAIANYMGVAYAFQIDLGTRGDVGSELARFRSNVRASYRRSHGSQRQHHTGRHGNRN